ncbi:unnamed protein product [Adineta steineri]|uniref:PNPLA domain-containing protein n=1 Tax=Adineta steineri TaxID=433720 RepID=A0A814FJM8_9BILA|nr:unnamed protein product [Adineta steineri]
MIHKILDTFKNQEQLNLEPAKGQNDNSLLLKLTELSNYLSDLQYHCKVKLVSFVLSHRCQVRSILFTNIPLTEEKIQSHTKNLFVLFHPDKCRVEEKPKFTEIFQLIAEDANKQLKQLMKDAHQTNLAEYYERKGKESWDIAVDYKSAKKQEWDKLKRLTRERLMNLSNKELEDNQYYHAECAYEQYRAVSRELEAVESNSLPIVKKVELRKYMALCLYLAGPKQRLEAQIYIIAGIHLAVRSGNILHCKDSLEALEKLLRKIHRANARLFVVPTSTSEKKHDIVLSKALVAFKDGLVSLNQLENAISSELRMTILNKCSLRGEERKVAIPEESTLQVRKKGIEFISKAVVGAGAGAVVAGGCIVDSVFGVSASATIGTFLGGPIGTVIGIGIGLTSLVGGALLGYVFCKRSLPYLKEPKIRETLNNIMENVLNHYKNGEYSDALYCLSVPYNNNKTLLSISDVEKGNIYKVLLKIQPGLIVETLSYHDFPPEGIAYFLVLLGEILLFAPQLKPNKVLSANMILELPDYSDFNHLAIKVFEEVWVNESLMKRAKRIDEQIKSKILSSKNIYVASAATATLAYHYSVSRDYIKERLVTPVTVRVEELTSIAQINYAIAQMIVGGTGNLEKCANTIKGIKEQLLKEKDGKKMFFMKKTRLQALSDLLAAFGHPDDVPISREESFYGSTTFSEIEGPIFIRTINTVVSDNHTISHCEPIVLFDNDGSDELMLLDNILGGILRLNKNKFFDDVYKAYSNHIEPLTTLIDEIMQQNNFSTINQWKESFLEKKHTFTFRYLVMLSVIYNLIFKLCISKACRNYGHSFSVTGDIVDFSTGVTPATVYALVDRTNVSSNDRPIKGVFVSDDIPFNYIYNRLESVRDQKLEANLLNRIGLYYQCQAEQIDKTHHLTALPKWNYAMRSYSRTLKFDKRNLIARLGFAKCLIKLSKYKQAETSLREEGQENSEFSNSAERWFLLGIVKRKLQKLDEALYSIHTALGLQDNFMEAQQELNIIRRLKEEPTTERIKLYKRMSTIHAEPAREEYNILSIDGGGIRGLIPAVWINELERRVGLKSCSMFHMMAGTSTGAVIAAGLSCPASNSVTLPRYTATEIVELYTIHSSEVFSRERFRIPSFISSPKYTDKGRKRLFNSYFENTRLSQALTGLVITAVRSGSTGTDLFRRSESLIDRSKDYKLADILMCSTAAPTYFQPYNLENTAFVDGGVQANNPAMIAYTEACNNGVNRDNIFIVSLGTGDYVPDPLHPNANRNLLFWLTNKDSVLKVIFDGPQNNIDYQLNIILGTEKYHRWQVWLEDPIALDDIRKETLDKLIELARAHFEEMDASDSNNRLGKLIERLRGPAN